MIMWLIGKVPQTGEITEWQGWRFEIVDLDGNRIDKVLATQITAPETPAETVPVTD